MLNLFKWAMLKYKSFIVKMHFDSIKNKITQDNLLLFGDLEFIFGLPYFLPMLKVVHTLFKFA
jgi:hypothetical protein